MIKLSQLLKLYKFADARNKKFLILTNKVGLNDKTATDFIELFGNRCIIMANIFFEDYSKEEIKKYYLTANDKNMLTGIRDFINVEHNGDISAFKTYSFNELLSEAEEWHKNLKQKDDYNYDENNEIVIDYRNGQRNGYYWARLSDSNSCAEEAKRMGHCGSSIGVLYSLRLVTTEVDKYGKNIEVSKSVVTASINEETGEVYQCKGRFNQKPDEKYRDMIFDFYKKYATGYVGEYENEEDFSLKDFSAEQIDELIKEDHPLSNNIYVKLYAREHGLIKPTNNNRFESVYFDEVYSLLNYIKCPREMINDLKHIYSVDDVVEDYISYTYEAVDNIIYDYIKSNSNFRQELIDNNLISDSSYVDITDYNFQESLQSAIYDIVAMEIIDKLKRNINFYLDREMCSLDFENHKFVVDIFYNVNIHDAEQHSTLENILEYNPIEVSYRSTDLSDIYISDLDNLFKSIAEAHYN